LPAKAFDMKSLALFLLCATTALASPFLRIGANRYRLEFSTQPSASVTDGQALAQQPVVRIVDGSGNTVTTSSAKITLSIASGTAALTVKAPTSQENLTVTAVNGVATFVGLKLHGTGSVTLKATARRVDNAASATSNAITINATTASKLGILLQPGGAVTTQGLRIQPIVEIQDSRGRKMTSSTATVAVAIQSGTGTLSGTTSVAAVNGVATFTNLVITGTGAHTLRFTSTGLTLADSASFTVLAGTVPQTALTFAASSSDNVNHGSAAAIDDLPAGGVFTAAAWVYRAADQAGTQYVMVKNPSSSAGWTLSVDNIDANGQIKGTIRRATLRTSWASSNTGAFDTCRVGLNTWTFIAMVYDEADSQEMRLYIGTETSPVQEVSAYSTTGGFNQNGDGAFGSDAAANLIVGRGNTGTESFNGQIGAVYCRANKATLTELRAMQANIWATSSAAFLCGLGENGTGSQADLSGNGSAGTVTGATAWPTVAATLTMNPASTFQTMAGFGASARMFDDPHVTNTFDGGIGKAAPSATPSSAQQDEILKALYTELGLTRVKYNAGEGGTQAKLEPTANDNSDPVTANIDAFDYRYKLTDGLMDHFANCEDFGATTKWGAVFALESYLTNASDPEEYGEYAERIVRRWAAMGQPLHYLSILNEPGLNNTAIHANGTWNGTFIRDAIKSLGPRISAAGLSTVIIAPEDLNSEEANGRITTIMADATARGYTGVLCYHNYGGSDQRAAIKTTADTYSKPIWMTEWTQTDEFLWAQFVAECIGTHGVSAVDYMWSFFGDWVNSEESMLIRIDLSGTTYTGYTKTKHYYVLGQWSRFVRPGAVRISGSSTDSGIKVNAFTVGTDTVYVLTNTNVAARQTQIDTGSLALSGKKLFAYRTSTSENWVNVDLGTRLNSRLDVNLPATSVTTIVVR
jgi:hypothetical protein